MAVLAWLEDIAVVKYCTSPCIFRMAVVAVIGAREMLRMFAWRTAAIMAKVAHQWCALELAADMTA